MNKTTRLLGRGIILFTLLLLLALLASVSFAKTDLFSFQDFYDAEEYAEVMDFVSTQSGALSQTSILGPAGDDLQKVSYAYKLYNLKNGDFRPLSNVELEIDLDDEYSWILITDDIARIEIRKGTGIWELAQFVEAPKEVEYSNRVRTEMLQDAISSLTVRNIVAFRAQLLRDTVFVYIKAGEGDFLVPFAKRPEWTEMENGHLYTREEMARIIKEENKEILEKMDAVENGEYPFYVRSPIVQRANVYTYEGEGILMAGDGAGAGRVFHHAFGKYAIHQRVYCFHNFRDINTNYFCYFISELFKKVMDKGSAQSTVPSVRLPMIQDFVFCLPSAEEQLAIVEYLDNKCGQIDELIAEKESLIVDLDAYKKSLIFEVVTGKRKVV